ncbi:MAG: hypothetical protein WBW41_09730 [Verrucomicrobiia bacterium]
MKRTCDLGVYPGKGMSSTRTFAIVEPLVVMAVIAIRTATKIAKTCNSRL